MFARVTPADAMAKVAAVAENVNRGLVEPSPCPMIKRPALPVVVIAAAVATVSAWFGRITITSPEAEAVIAD
jgi:predicted neuraminidase